MGLVCTEVDDLGLSWSLNSENAHAIIVNQKLICYGRNIRLMLVLLTYFFSQTRCGCSYNVQCNLNCGPVKQSCQNALTEILSQQDLMFGSKRSPLRRQQVTVEPCNLATWPVTSHDDVSTSYRRRRDHVSDAMTASSPIELRYRPWWARSEN